MPLLLGACAEPHSPLASDAPASAAATGADLQESLALPPLAPDASGKVTLTEAEWRARLGPDRYRILREAGTERAFTGDYWKTDGKVGVYHCAGCDLPLFSSATKFDSGTGWPSFYQPIAPDRVKDKPDLSYGMVRTENICARCDGHLGHVFEDGPPPTGLRYCMNSLALRFVAATTSD